MQPRDAKGKVIKKFGRKKKDPSTVPVNNRDQVLLDAYTKLSAAGVTLSDEMLAVVQSHDRPVSAAEAICILHEINLYNKHNLNIIAGHWRPLEYAQALKNLYDLNDRLLFTDHAETVEQHDNPVSYVEALKLLQDEELKWEPSVQIECLMTIVRHYDPVAYVRSHLEEPRLPPVIKIAVNKVKAESALQGMMIGEINKLKELPLEDRYNKFKLYECIVRHPPERKDASFGIAMAILRYVAHKKPTRDATFFPAREIGPQEIELDTALQELKNKGLLNEEYFNLVIKHKQPVAMASALLCLDQHNMIIYRNLINMVAGHHAPHLLAQSLGSLAAMKIDLTPDLLGIIYKTS